MAGSETDAPSGVVEEPAASRLTGRISEWKARFERVRERVRERVEGTAAGRVQRRIVDFEIMNRAMILSALALMLFIPALISLTAVLPLGRDHGFAAHWVHRLGLSPEAAKDVRQLFNTSNTVRGPATFVSALVTIVFAFGWPAELRRGYEIIWGLPARGKWDVLRPLLWLVVFFGVVATILTASSLASGLGGAFVTGLVGLPVVTAWAWWGQHMLLSARVPWRPLLPGALVTAVGLFALNLSMIIYLPRAIVSNFESYGPIGVVFALLSWMVGFSVVMLGGPLVGHTIVANRR